MMILHNHGGLVPSIARIFGSDFAMVFVNPKETISTHIYEVSRINMTELDSRPCTPDKNPPLSAIFR